MPYLWGRWACGRCVATAVSKRPDTFSVHYKDCVYPCGCHISPGVPVHPMHRVFLRVADFSSPQFYKHYLCPFSDIML